MVRSLTPFPEKSGESGRGPAGLVLIRAADEHLPFLQTLYAEWQSQELRLLPWPEAEKRRIIRQQFEFQHHQWVTHYPLADFWIVASLDGQARGRLYLDRSTAPWRLIDILLSESARCTGIGTALLRWIQQEAAEAGAGVTLHVGANNPRARSLYERLGFTALPIEGQQLHLPMQWAAGDRQQ